MDAWYDAPRFFISKDEVDGVEHQALLLTGPEAHHAVKVVRIKPGDPVVLLDGTGQEYLGRVEHVHKGSREPRVSIGDVTVRPSPTEPPFAVHLVQALPKADKFEFVVQKGTEVGVTHFWPVYTDRVVVEYTPQKVATKEARWRRIAQEAAKQSRRGIAPYVGTPEPVADVVDRLVGQGCPLLVFWENSDEPLRGVLTRWKEAGVLDAPSFGGVAIVIGPEGGLSDAEVGRLRQLGAECASMGPRILRAETAGVIAVALTLYELLATPIPPG